MPLKDPAARRAYNREYKRKNRDRVNEQKRQSRLRNIEAAKKRDRLYRLRNHEACLERDREYHRRNRDERVAAMAEYYQKAKEKKRKYNKKYYRDNIGAIRKQAKEYRDANKDKIKEYCRTHKDIRSDCCHRYRARKHEATVEHVSRAVVYERDRGRCHICNKRVPKKGWHLDHLIPLSRGGEHSYRNVAVSCPSCNIRKHTGALPSQLRVF